MKRQHPAALVGYTSKNFWLLLIPLLRGLAALKFDFYTWIEGAGWDILIVAAIFAMAVEKWYFTFYSVSEKGIRVKSGLFARSDISIPPMNISAVTSEENPFTAKLGAVRVYIDTDAAEGKKNSADLRLLIYAEDRAKLFNILSEAFKNGRGNEKKYKNGMNYTYKVSAVSLIAFSLLFSSALSGVLLISAAVSGGTKIVGNKLESDFFNAVNNVSDAVLSVAGRVISVSDISPAGIAFTVVIAFGFIISFVGNILRHLKFTASRQGKCIVITSGVVVKRMYIINSRKINIADMRQNLLMKLFGLTSVHVNCTGYGKRKNELPVFVPVCSARRRGTLPHVMDRLLTGFSRSETYINTRLPYIWRFIWPPALLIFLIMGAELVCVMVFPQWLQLIRFMAVLCEIPAVWMLFAKACAYCTNGFNITEDSVCAKYSKWYEFHNITVPLDRVAEIRITQTIFQRMNKSCDVHIFTNSEHIGSHCVRSMPIREVQEIIRERF